PLRRPPFAHMYEYPNAPVFTQAFTFTPGMGRTPPPTSLSVTMPRIVRLPRGGLGASLLGVGSSTALAEVGVSAFVSEALQPAMNRISEHKGASRRRFMRILPM